MIRAIRGMDTKTIMISASQQSVLYNAEGLIQFTVAAFEIPIRTERDSRLFALPLQFELSSIAFRVTVIEFTHSVSLEVSISLSFRFSSSLLQT